MSRKDRRKAAALARQTAAVSPTPASIETESPSTVPVEAGAPVEDLRRAYLDRFQPVDAIERDLVEEMITAQTRQRCLARIEETAFAPLESASPEDVATVFERQAKLLASVDRTRKAYAQQFSRALATLTKLRASSKPAKKQAAPPQPQPSAPEPNLAASQAVAPQVHPTLAPEPDSALPGDPQTPDSPHLAMLGNSPGKCYNRETAFCG